MLKLVKIYWNFCDVKKQWFLSLLHRYFLGYISSPSPHHALLPQSCSSHFVSGISRSHTYSLIFIPRKGKRKQQKWTKVCRSHTHSPLWKCQLPGATCHSKLHLAGGIQILSNNYFLSFKNKRKATQVTSSPVVCHRNEGTVRWLQE